VVTAQTRLWKVRVIGEHGPKPKRAWWTVLVEAPSSDEAMAKGAAAVSAVAPSDRLWTMFEAREAASVSLPMVIAGDA
jgi:hypothetical protein